MAYLLDTHALIWWWSGGLKLGRNVRDLLSKNREEIFVSAVSSYEMASKYGLGKLPEIERALANFDGGVTEEGFRHLEVRWDHALHAGLLPGDHRDPFDRLIAAQALIEGLTVVTRDRQFAAFGCEVVW